MQISALQMKGWTVSAIARHVQRDRKTVRAYLSGQREAGVRRGRSVPDPVEAFVPYLRQRLADDPHVWVSTLADELAGLGYGGGYSTLTRAVRDRGLRPHCEPCAASRGREHAIIEHPVGEETQWDWLELPDPPRAWGWGSRAHLLVGSLSHAGAWAAALAEAEDQPHLVRGIHHVAGELGGVTKVWRFDRMATVFDHARGGISASFAAVAKHYRTEAVVCPPRHGNRKGVVEKGNHSFAQRWWRTLPDGITVEAAQADLDAFSRRGDARKRTRDGQPTTVGQLLAPVPEGPFPLTVAAERVVSAQCLVAWRGNCYSVPPGLPGRRVLVRQRLGEPTLEIATCEGRVTLAVHRAAADGAGAIVRAEVHVAALEKRVLAAFDDRPACKSKTRRPPSAQARAEAEAIRASATGGRAGRGEAGQKVVVDFDAYLTATRSRTVAQTSTQEGGTAEPRT